MGKGGFGVKTTQNLIRSSGKRLVRYHASIPTSYGIAVNLDHDTVFKKKHRHSSAILNYYDTIKSTVKYDARLVYIAYVLYSLTHPQSSSQI